MTDQIIQILIIHHRIMNRLCSFLFFIILLIGTAPVKATHISSAELREAALKAQGLPKEQSITIISKKTYVFILFNQLFCVSRGLFFAVF